MQLTLDDLRQIAAWFLWPKALSGARVELQPNTPPEVEAAYEEMMKDDPDHEPDPDPDPVHAGTL